MACCDLGVAAPHGALLSTGVAVCGLGERCVLGLFCAGCAEAGVLPVGAPEEYLQWYMYRPIRMKITSKILERVQNVVEEWHRRVQVRYVKWP